MHTSNEKHIARQKQRLVNLIKTKYQVLSGYLDDKQHLCVKGDRIDLKPLLNAFGYLLKSKEYTHLSPLFDSSENFSIADMYVELTVSKLVVYPNPYLLSQGTILAQEIEKKHHRQRAKRLTIEEAIHNEKHHHIVILGEPGSGKTSLIKYLTLQIAKGESPRWLIPIHISLRQYWHERKTYQQNGKTLTLAQYGAERLINNYSHSKSLADKYSVFLSDIPDESMADESLPFIANVIAHSNGIDDLLLTLSGTNREHVLFLLDGFDELASQKEAMDTLNTEIRQLSHHFSWVLTSRPTGFYGDLHEDIRYEMIGLHNQGITDLVCQWFAQVKDLKSHTNQRDILIQIQSNPRLLTMARNPFLLTLLCNIRQFNDKPLPILRSEVYDQIIYYIRKQLRHREKNNALFGKKEYDYLKHFCYYLYTDAINAPVQLFDLDQWQACAEPKKPPSLKKHFLASRLINCWQENSDYHFSHLTFQEYFIAQHMANLPFEEVKKHLYKSHWRIILRFLAGIYWQQNNRENFLQLLNSVTASIDLAGLLYIEAAWFCVEAGLEDSTQVLGEDLRELLWEIWSDSKIHNYTASQHYREVIAEALTTLDQNFVYKQIKDLSSDTPITSKEVFLLGHMTLAQSDKMLIDLFYTQAINPNLVNAVIAAIAMKATPEIRQHIMAKKPASKETWAYNRLTLLARQTKHSDFIPHLISQLDLITKINLDKQTSLLKAIDVINDPAFYAPLHRLISAYTNLEEIPKDLLTSYAKLNTDKVKAWFRLHFKASTTIFLLAVEQNWLPANLIIKQLNQLTSMQMGHYLDAIERRVVSGELLDKSIEKYIAKIAFSEHTASISALRITVSVTKNKSSHNLDEDAIQYTQSYRLLLEHTNQDKVAIAIDALGSLLDLSSFDTIMNMANSDDLYAHQERVISIIDALTAFAHSSKRPIVIKQLQHLVKGLLNQYQSYAVGTSAHGYYEQVLQIGLESLISVDIRLAADYLNTHFPQHIMMDVLCYISIEKGYIFFKDHYITPQGETLSWDIVNTPKPKLALSKLANEQQDTLRALCHYLLDTHRASRAGHYIKGKGKTPLFKGDEHTVGLSVFVNSISRSAGQKFLAGQELHPNKAQTLMTWIVNNFNLDDLIV